MSQWPKPSSDNKHSGYLLKLGELNKNWKRRWCTLDRKTGYLYWWSKPDGKVKGAFSLSKDATVTSLPAPEYAFRISSGKLFRDFRAESSATLPTWISHIQEQIDGGRSGSVRTKAESRNFALEDGGDARLADLEAELEGLEVQMMALREENERLRKQQQAGGEEGARERELESENAALKLRLEELEEEGDEGGPSKAALLDELEDLKYHLGAAKRRIKQLESKNQEAENQLALLRGADDEGDVVVPGL